MKNPSRPTDASRLVGLITVVVIVAVLYLAREVCEANEAALDYVESSTGGHFCIEFRRIEPG